MSRTSFRTFGPAGRAMATSVVEAAPYWGPVLGAAVRLSYVLRYDFPLTDGGLFYVMAQELQRSGYALPWFTAYNQGGIPFAYPPLGLYLAAITDQIGPWSLLDVFRFLPLILNVATIVAFYALAREMLATRYHASYATVAFALLPFSFYWEIAGGGVTRSPGFLFAVLALWQGYRLYRGGSLRHAWLTTLFSAATVLSHPSMALFLAYSLALFFFAFGRSRRGLAHSALVAGGTLVLSAPWWLTVGLRYGFESLHSATGTHEAWQIGILRLAFLQLTFEPLFAMLGGLALLGLAASLARKHVVLPAWVFAALMIDWRGGVTGVTLPLGLLAGIGLAEVLVPWLNRAGERAFPETELCFVPTNTLAAVAVAFVLQYAAITVGWGLDSILGALRPPEREAMAWIASHVPASSRFVVIAPGERGHDRTVEWFPALTGRQSVTTYQGREWLGAGRFWKTMARHRAAQECAGGTVDCLENVRLLGEEPFTHVFLIRTEAEGEGKVSTAALRCSLAHSDLYELIYDGQGTQVYRRLP